MPERSRVSGAPLHAAPRPGKEAFAGPYFGIMLDVARCRGPDVRTGGLMILIPAIIVGGHLVVAVADRPPVVNFEQTCRAATTGDLRLNDSFEICVADEKRARDQLARQWSSFDPAARTQCARTSTSGHAASYIELLTCLELDQADREVHGHASTGGMLLTAPERPVSERDVAPEPSQSRPAPIADPPRPAQAPRPAQRSVAAAAPPAAPPAAEPLPISPSGPTSPSEPTSQTEVLQQSLCRSPLGYVLPGCR
jgi:hypothetical protein